ncbi:hypothetical protein [Aquipseudomonas ullengensis]|uniref:Uncharacterized protein n=1 Tax=Aquipseudomonas ullengensis TaxID=2759166 RepID=A0A7W4LP08_9GAMM|nr:hypothetical protein [Pseudomonas ullengensis]MBB2496658.1 hypothetical protein [Pseudomonas ullengensis]
MSRAARTPAAPAAITLSIGSLALPGYSRRDGQRLAGAFEHELGRLLAQLSARELQGFQAERLQLPCLQGLAGERPERTGQRLARVIAAQLQAGAGE